MLWLMHDDQIPVYIRLKFLFVLTETSITWKTQILVRSEYVRNPNFSALSMTVIRTKLGCTTIWICHVI